MQPTKKSVALVITDSKNRFLVVLRAKDTKDPLEGVWGFPAATITDSESELEAALRIGKTKLGVEIKVGSKIGKRSQKRSNYTLHLSDFKAKIVSGIPSVPQSDSSLSQYDAWKFTDDPTILCDAARKGSLCSQIFLESIGITW